MRVSFYVMDAPIEGTTAPGFEPVRAAFAANFDDGVEVGAAFCVLRDGEVLVDLWGGYRDAALTEPWHADTLVNVYSSTKGLAAAAVATLVDAGELGYEDRVRDIWPALGAASGGLTVSQLLSHQAGLCGLRAPLQVADLYDWDGVCRRLEREPPFWLPGTAAGYHAVTWGFLVGELVRRVSGVSLGTLFRTRIGETLDADVFIGLPDAEHGRVADLIGPNRARRPPPPAPPDAAPPPPLNAVALQNPLIRPFADACSGPWRRAELAASNGHASARGIARVYAALAGGGTLGGRRVLGPGTVAALGTEVWGTTPDLVLGYPMRRGRGVNLNTHGEFGPGKGAFGHTGTGGSLGFADPGQRLGVGYAMNQLWGGTGPESRSGGLLAALFECLERTP